MYLIVNTGNFHGFANLLGDYITYFVNLFGLIEQLHLVFLNWLHSQMPFFENDIQCIHDAIKSEPLLLRRHIVTSSRRYNLFRHNEALGYFLLSSKGSN